MGKFFVEFNLLCRILIFNQFPDFGKTHLKNWLLLQVQEVDSQTQSAGLWLWRKERIANVKTAKF